MLLLLQVRYATPFDAFDRPQDDACIFHKNSFIWSLLALNCGMYDVYHVMFVLLLLTSFTLAREPFAAEIAFWVADCIPPVPVDL